ncbi:MAG TPA: aspartyl protease family protein [Armatimonadota bacterium]|nr:aspartyl protease family protein [Armatimonadota bacterium]
MLRLFTALAFALLLAAGSYPVGAFQEKTPAGRRSTTIPFEPLGISNMPTPLIRMRLNGVTTGTFLVDTGATTTTITDRLARQLGLPLKPAVPTGDAAPGPGPGDQPIEFVTLERLQLGNLTLADVLVAVIPAERLSKAWGEGVDGVLGANVLIHGAALFDFERGKFGFFMSGALSPAELKKEGFDGTVFVSMKESQYGWRLVDVPVGFNDQATENLLLDTGSSITTLPSQLARNLKLDPLGPKGTAVTFYGQSTEDTAFVKRLSLGSQRMRNVLVAYRTDQDSKQVPLLGIDVLSRFRILIDFPAKKLYLTENQAPAPRVPAAPSQVSSARLDLIGPSEHPGLEATLSGAQRCVFRLDLAGRHSRLERDSGRELGPVLPTFAPGLGGPVEIVKSDLQLGGPGLRLHQVPFVLEELTRFREGVPAAHGFLGRDALRHLALRLDFVKNRVDFIAPGAIAGTEHEPKNAVKIPLQIEHGQLFVEAQLDGQDVMLLVNPLSDECIISSNSLLGQVKPQGTLEYPGGDEALKLLRLSRLAVGKAVWQGPIFATFSKEERRAKFINTLGLTFLRRFLVLFDFPAKTMYLQPNPAYVEDPNRWVSTGFLPSFPGSGKLIVRSVAISSPAEKAGLRPKDEIVEVNGRAVNQLTPAQLSTEFKKGEGAEVTVRVRREGEDQLREIRLKVKKLL